MKKQTRLMLTAILILCGVMTSCKKETTDPEHGTVKLQCEKPDYLVEGDTVALISPSYFTPMENVEHTAEVLRGWGLMPIIGPNVGKIYQGKYAGTVEERVSDLRWALNRQGVKAIICNRGGYGTIQLINHLTFNDFKANPKWLVGFSDISTLHGLESRAGVMSIHGTMSSYLAAGGTDATSTLMRDLLMGQVPRYELPAHPQNIMGQAQGVLVGGNICTFAPNLGTQADATQAEDIILFIEEVGESMHNIDRQFNIFVMNGVLDRCKGVILGSFVSCGSEFEYESIEAMLRSYLTAYNIPVMCGFPAGHDDINLPLVMGAPVTMDVRADGATLQFDIEGQQTEIHTPDISATKTPLEYRLKCSGKRE
jgi:muramoyltetrapeptide carboxypeptidase